MVTILSIDGGGIRGIIPATLLIEFEKRTGRPICELFDLIAGTSTGGILAAALTVSNGRGRPRHTAKAVRDAYVAHGAEIFHRSTLRKVATLGGLTRPRYSPRALERMLIQFLGGERLHATLSEILITAYDMASSTPWFFKTWFAKRNHMPVDDPLLTQVVLATTAAPTYFPPLEMEGHCLIDGGVFASNPSLCAYAEARNLYPFEREFFIVSLGTGLQAHERSCSQVENWGIARWAAPISTVMLNSSSATVDYQMRALLGELNYARFQVRLGENASDMDDASEENIRRLEALARQEVIRNNAAIERVCKVLTAREKNISFRWRDTAAGGIQRYGT